MRLSAAAILLAAFAVHFTACDSLSGFSQWPTYTLVFHANGGQGIMDPTTHRHGQPHYLPANAFTRVGHDLEGWARTPGGEKAFYAGQHVVGLGTRAAGDTIDLFAVWHRGGFIVTFDANGGDGNAPAPVTLDAGDGLTLPDQGGLYRYRHSFGGWTTGSGTPYRAGTRFVPDGDATLFAVWHPYGTVFVVTFAANGGSGVGPAPMEVNAGQGLTLPHRHGFSRDGHEFGGWNTLADGTGDLYAVGSVFVPHGDATLHAAWRSGCDVYGCDWGAWATTIAATCTAPGVETRICLRCGHPETRFVPALGHNWGAWAVTTAPACTTPGVETRTCQRCGHSETRPVDPLGHNWGAWTVTTAPACTIPGIETRTCQRCGHSETRPVDPPGYDWGEWAVTTAPACTTPGVETRTCQRCGHPETRYTDPIGHDWGDWELTTAPTPSLPGQETRTCQRCGATETRPVAALGHDCARDGHVLGNWEPTTAPTCTTQGIETRICQHTGCGHAETRPVPELGHNWGNWTLTTDPTCTTAGVETLTCHRCGTTETRPVDALGHNWGNWILTTAPTCTTDGVETRTCLHPGCSHSETRPIPSTGHDWGDWTVTTAPTPSTPGVETRICANCGTAETRPVPPLEPGRGTFAIDFAGFQNLAPIVAGPTFSLRDLAAGATPSVMVANPAGGVRWFHDGGRITAGVLGQRGEILLLGPAIHGNRIGTHRVTVEVETTGLWHSRVVTFTVTP